MVKLSDALFQVDGENISIENTTLRAPRLWLTSPSGVLQIEQSSVSISGDLIAGSRVGIGSTGTIQGLEVCGKVKFANPNSFIYGEITMLGNWDEVLLSVSREGTKIHRLNVLGRLLMTSFKEEGMVSKYNVNTSGEAYWVKIGPLLLQWGRQRTGLSDEGYYSITFPREFKSTPSVAVTADVTNYLDPNSFDYWIQVASVTKRGFKVWEQRDGDISPPSDSWDVFINWIAVGEGT